MWKVERHGQSCSKEGRIFVTRKKCSVEDLDGNTLDAYDTSGGEVLRAECDECGMVAFWYDKQLPEKPCLDGSIAV
jgi:hypothetical protein